MNPFQSLFQFRWQDYAHLISTLKRGAYIRCIHAVYTVYTVTPCEQRYLLKDERGRLCRVLNVIIVIL